MSANLKITELPFFFQSHSKKDNGGFPAVLPFKLYYDHELEMFRQHSWPELIRLLDAVYQSGSLADGSISSESGAAYLDKVIEYIYSHYQFKSDSRILEVGFGSGVVLKALKDRGIAGLTGVEPGNHSRVAGLDDIVLIKDYFPTPQIKEKYDLVYSLFVLEHIVDPIAYLGNLAQALTDGGKVVVGVPNCEPYLKEGDLSIFIHEHFSYFTRKSLFQLAMLAGMKVVDVSTVEGALLATFVRGEPSDCSVLEETSPDVFYKATESHVAKLNQLLCRYSAQEIAIYAPIRAMNALYLSKMTGCRLIDDSSQVQGKYLPTMDNSIESFEQLAENAPRCVLIFSRTFGERIKKKCLADSRLKNSVVMTLDDLN